MGNAVATAFMVGVFFVFIAWLPSYLINGKHLSLAGAGILSSVMYAGAVSGNLAGGWLSDNLLGMRRKPLMMLGALFTSAALIAVIFSPADEFLLGALLLATGFIVGLGYSHFFSYPMSLTTRETYPIAFGVLNTGAVLAAGVFPFMTGVILDNGSWALVFLFLSACALLCFLFLTTIREASTSP
jgi:sugar phosphate permease